ncbi:MAG: 50S ribosomal protein L17 [Gaiellaceae bacterium]
MRHARAGKKLGRDSAHRKALYSNLAGALIEHGRIKTTVTKAKAMKPHVEQMITLGRRGDLHARRQATAFLRSRDVVHKLFTDVAPLFKDRPGGYTRIIKIGTRPGDSAEMAYIELVDDEYVATQREERTPEPVEAAEPVVVPDVPVEAAEELPETEQELVEDPEAAEDVLAAAEEPPVEEPAAEADATAAEAEGDEPAASDEKS